MNKENRIILFQKRVELFMKYCNEFGFPKYTDGIRFCDISLDIVDRGVLYSWFFRELTNLHDLEIEIEKYRIMYPIAYLDITNRLFVRSKKISSESRIKYFMQYIEENEWLSERASVRFCDIDSSAYDTTNVGIWFVNYFKKNRENVRLIASKYQTEYPKAFQKIVARLEKVTLSFEERFKYVMFYLDEFHVNSIEKGITFSDLSELVSFGANAEKISDLTEVNGWFKFFLREHLDLLEKTCVAYSETCPYAYLWMMNKIHSRKLYQTRQVLSFEERVCLYLSYLNLEPNQVVSSVGELQFMNLVSKEKIDVEKFPNLAGPITDTTLVSSWQKRVFFEKREIFIKECMKYKDIYPLGVQKIQDRINHYRILLSFDEKMKLFMGEVEVNDIPKWNSTLRFCDLSNETFDTSVVRTWFVNNLSDSLEDFIEACLVYQTEYPNAYQKITAFINHSKVRTRKERILLTETLKEILSQVINSSDFTENNVVSKSFKKCKENVSKK